MGHRPFIWICHCCNENQRGKPGELLCLRCAGDASVLRSIYTTIVVRFPALSQLSMADVFRRLWVKFRKDNKLHGKKKKEPASPSKTHPNRCTTSEEACVGSVKESLCEDPF